MINLSKLQWIVVGVVVLIVIVVLDVLIGTTITPRLIAAPTPTPTMPTNVLFVKPEANGDCRENWFHACDLQTALSKALPDEEIWVLEGTYKPTSEKDQMATFQLKSGVALYGGFAGKETSRDERNWEENITILSGDIDDNDITENGVITTTTNITGTNSIHVVTGSGTDATAILDGFTITGGQANGTQSGNCGPACGGGMYNDGGGPTLTNVAFSGNFADGSGGGMWNYNGSPSLTNVSFMGDTATRDGGGMSNYNNSSPNLTNVTFSGNSAGSYGGGMFNGTESNSQLTDVTFSGNTAADSGGGMHNYSSSPVLIATQFINNTAPLGGGMFNNTGNPTLTNTNFISNTAKRDGGGMYNLSSSPILTSTEFISNAATQDGGGMYNTRSSPTLTNVIFSGNQAHSPLTDHGGGGMYNTSSSPTLVHVNFEGNTARVWGGGMYNRDESSPSLVNVTFHTNTADAGGGMFSQGGQPMLVNVVFLANEANINGGGLHTYASSKPTLTNVTFSGNSAQAGGGMYNLSSSPTLTNCILWGNTASEASNGPQIYNDNNSTTNVNYSLVQDSGGSGQSWDTRLGDDGGQNIDADAPPFVDLANGNLRLKEGSPAINAGNKAAVPAGVTTDLDGKPRVVCDKVDMGAYEYQAETCP